MLYCPKCKNEYQDGYTYCNDCDCDLVPFEELYPKVPVYFGSMEEMEVLTQFFGDNGLSSAEMRESDEEDTYEVIVEQDDEKKARKLLGFYLADKNKAEAEVKLKKLFAEGANEENEDEFSDPEDLIDDDLEEDLKQELSDLAAMEQMYEPVKVHENSTEKGKEYMSTGYMLIVVGIIGLVVDVMVYMDKFFIHFASSNKILSCGVMALFFMLFIGFGFSSIKSAKSLLAQGDQEDLMKTKIADWAKKELTKEKIDDGYDFSSEDETAAYFKRSEKMKTMIKAEFEIDDLLLEEIIEQYYEEIFG